MARRRLLECAFLIPVRGDRALSDGRRHGWRAWRWLEERLSDFGGATRDTALHEGWYLDRDTGERVTDRSRRYVVGRAAKAVTRLRALLREACGVFQQKCIYLSVAGQVELVEGVRDESR